MSPHLVQSIYAPRRGEWLDPPCSILIRLARASNTALVIHSSCPCRPESAPPVAEKARPGWRRMRGSAAGNAWGYRRDAFRPRLICRAIFGCVSSDSRRGAFTLETRLGLKNGRDLRRLENGRDCAWRHRGGRRIEPFLRCRSVDGRRLRRRRQRRRYSAVQNTEIGRGTWYSQGRILLL